MAETTTTEIGLTEMIDNVWRLSIHEKRLLKTLVDGMIEIWESDEE